MDGLHAWVGWMDGLAGWAVDTANVGLHECRAVDTANQMDGLCGLDGWLFTCPKGFLLLFGHVFEHIDWPLAEPLGQGRSLVSAALADVLYNVKRTLLGAVAFLADTKTRIFVPALFEHVAVFELFCCSSFSPHSVAFFCRAFILCLFFCCAAAVFSAHL